MGWAILWLALCVVVAVAASHRGRSPIVWGLVALVISPLIGLLLVLVMNRVEPPASPVAEQTSAMTAGPQITPSANPRFDGVINGRPYRKTPDGMIEVNTGAGMRRYMNLEQAAEAVMKG